MTPRLIAALLGALGGLLLSVAGGLSFLGRETPPDWHGTLAVAGYGLSLAALCAMGYGVVARAPVWLRIIVSVAYPLLVASVWQLVDQAIEDQVEGWKADATTHLVAGLIVLVVSLFGFRRPAGSRSDAYLPTHHR